MRQKILLNVSKMLLIIKIFGPIWICGESEAQKDTVSDTVSEFKILMYPKGNRTNLADLQHLNWVNGKLGSRQSLESDIAVIDSDFDQPRVLAQHLKYPRIVYYTLSLCPYSK